MAKLIFIQHDGSTREVPMTEDLSLMQIARDNAVSGIDGDCGGSCACGTCHVIVDAAWVARLGAKGAEEQQILAMIPDVQPASRLACQILGRADLDGLTVRIPEYQM